MIARCRSVIVFEPGLESSDDYDATPEKIYELLVDCLGLRCFLMSDWLASDGLLSLDR